MNPDLSKSPTSVSAGELEAECLRRRYASLLGKTEVFPSENNWEYIISWKMPGLGPILYRKYLVSVLMPLDQRSIYHTLAIKNFPRYLECIPREHALDTVYSDHTSAPGAFIELVKSCRLFDADRILAIAMSGATATAISLLDAFQPDYDRTSEAAMRHLYQHLTALPEQGHIETRRSLLGSDTRYICPNGHTNKADSRYCSREDCRLDIHGLTAEENKAIDDFGLRIEALSSLLASL